MTFSDSMTRFCFPKAHRFVLIIDDDDTTTPIQTDVRFPSPLFSPQAWKSWVIDERILHLFVEHLDAHAPPERVTAFPVGLNHLDSWRCLRFTKTDLDSNS